MSKANRGWRVISADGTEIDGYGSEKEAREASDNGWEYERKKSWVAPMTNEAHAEWVNRTETPHMKWTCEGNARTVWLLRGGEFCHFPEFSSRGFTANGPSIMVRELGPMCANYTELHVNDPNFWTWMEDLITRSRRRGDEFTPMPELNIERDNGPRHTREQYEADWTHTRTGTRVDEDGNTVSFPDPREEA